MVHHQTCPRSCSHSHSVYLWPRNRGLHPAQTKVKYFSNSCYKIYLPIIDLYINASLENVGVKMSVFLELWYFARDIKSLNLLVILCEAAKKYTIVINRLGCFPYTVKWHDYINIFHLKSSKLFLFKWKNKPTSRFIQILVNRHL